PVLSGIDASSTEIRKTPSYAGKISQTLSAPQPSSGHQPSSALQPSSSGTQKVLKKRAVLDNLFPKKIKFAKQTGDEEAQIHNQQPKKWPSSSLVQKDIPTDIANYANASSLTDERKYHVLCIVWRPSATYTFPLDNDKRKFRFEWLNLFPWLAYSQKVDGAKTILIHNLYIAINLGHL
ncbi:Hypothetical predicted protein, partial [Paramuricea clavata]